MLDSLVDSRRVNHHLSLVHVKGAVEDPVEISTVVFENVDSSQQVEGPVVALVVVWSSARIDVFDGGVDSVWVADVHFSQSMGITGPEGHSHHDVIPMSDSVKTSFRVDIQSVISLFEKERVGVVRKRLVSHSRLSKRDHHRVKAEILQVDAHEQSSGGSQRMAGDYQLVVCVVSKKGHQVALHVHHGLSVCLLEAVMNLTIGAVDSGRIASGVDVGGVQRRQIGQVGLLEKQGVGDGVCQRKGASENNVFLFLSVIVGQKAGYGRGEKVASKLVFQRHVGKVTARSSTGEVRLQFVWTGGLDTIGHIGESSVLENEVVGRLRDVGCLSEGRGDK